MRRKKQLQKVNVNTVKLLKKSQYSTKFRQLYLGMCGVAGIAAGIFTLDIHCVSAANTKPIVSTQQNCTTAISQECETTKIRCEEPEKQSSVYRQETTGIVQSQKAEQKTSSVEKTSQEPVTVKDEIFEENVDEEAQQNFLHLDQSIYISGYRYENGKWLKLNGEGKIDRSFTGMGISSTDNWCYFSKGVENKKYTGMAYNEAGWWYYQDGIIDWNYTGLQTNEYGTWYYHDGNIDFSYSGYVHIAGVWYRIQDGHIDTEYTGIGTDDTDNWCYFVQGVENKNYTGMAYNEAGWWYYKDGVIDWNYTGLQTNEYGTWYYHNGNIDFTYTDFLYQDNLWYRIVEGRVDTEYTGMGTYDTDNWCYFVNGMEDRTYTGMACNEAGWWYYINGVIDWKHTGFEHNEVGWWYYIDGNIDFTYNNYIYWYGLWYKVRDGHVDTEYTGIGESYTDNWCYFIDGAESPNYTGVGENQYGGWYYINGQIDWQHSGYENNEKGLWYFLPNQAGMLFTGMRRIGGSDCFYKQGRVVSRDDYTYVMDYDDSYKRIACWGDSMTQGVGSERGYLSNQGIDISYENYPGHLRNMTGYHTMTHGYAGALSDEIVSYEREYYNNSNYGQEILLLEIGSNGGWNGDYNTLIEQYKQMIRNAGTAYYIIIGDTDDPGTSIGDVNYRSENGIDTEDDSNPDIEDEDTENEDYDDEDYDDSDDDEWDEEYIDGSAGFQTIRWEEALQEAFGDHFFNLREFMYEEGMDIVGLPITDTDEENLEEGKLPESLRFDWTHFNAYGYYAKAVGIYRKGVELGYWR